MYGAAPVQDRQKGCHPGTPLLDDMRMRMMMRMRIIMMHHDDVIRKW